MQIQSGLSAWCVGTAGEHLVCVDLALRGHQPTLAPAGGPYDVLVDTGGRILRVQVKTTTKPAYTPIPDGERKSQRHSPVEPEPRYQFALPKSTAERHEAEGEVDLFAFVALDLGRVCYRSPTEVYFDTPTTGVPLYESDFRKRSAVGVFS